METPEIKKEAMKAQFDELVRYWLADDEVTPAAVSGIVFGKIVHFTLDHAPKASDGLSFMWEALTEIAQARDILLAPVEQSPKSKGEVGN